MPLQRRLPKRGFTPLGQHLYAEIAPVRAAEALPIDEIDVADPEAAAGVVGQQVALRQGDQVGRTVAQGRAASGISRHGRRSRRHRGRAAARSAE